MPNNLCQTNYARNIIPKTKCQKRNAKNLNAKIVMPKNVILKSLCQQIYAIACQKQLSQKPNAKNVLLNVCQNRNAKSHFCQNAIAIIHRYW